MRTNFLITLHHRSLEPPQSLAWLSGFSGTKKRVKTSGNPTSWAIGLGSPSKGIDEHLFTRFPHFDCIEIDTIKMTLLSNPRTPDDSGLAFEGGNCPGGPFLSFSKRVLPLNHVSFLSQSLSRVLHQDAASNAAQIHQKRDLHSTF
jgi:hypothetical protein